MGKSINSKSIERNAGGGVGSKSCMNGYKTSKTEKHNREIEKLNEGFTQKLKQDATEFADKEYEYSIDSYELVPATPSQDGKQKFKQKYVFSSESDSPDHGKLITMNIDLGSHYGGLCIL
jgi:hypothetical protein